MSSDPPTAIENGTLSLPIGRRTPAPVEQRHSSEPHKPLSDLLNWLRAAVLGANDGIVSTAGIVIGVAGSTADRGMILTAGLAGLAAGAASMALGEYVSVASQRDTERAAAHTEARELREAPREELSELARLYEAKGLSSVTAHRVAVELTAHDALSAHLEVELGIDPSRQARPAQAAVASAVSFLTGGVLPLLAIVLSPAPGRVAITGIAVLGALTLTALWSARVGGTRLPRALLRTLVGGSLGMALTFAVGRTFGAALS